MKSPRLIASLAVCSVWVVVSVSEAVRAQVGAPGPVAGAATAQAPGPGRVGGAANGATLFTEQCAGCHGTGTTVGRAPNLFDQAWLNGVDDGRISNAIKHGVPNTEMAAFGTLNDQQIFDLIQHIRNQTAIAAPPQNFVANPNGTVVRSSKQAVRVELVADGLMTPWALAPFPDGRLLVSERDGRLRVID